MRSFRVLAMVLAVALSSAVATAQLAVKTNLLYDATTTPNLGAEWAMSSKSSLNLVYGLNPWKFSSQSHGQRFAKHWVVMPEYRWWLCTALNGHFFGIHAMGGQFNAANVDLPIPGGFFSGANLRNEVKDHRFQGGFVGAGITYGYQWSLARHWNLEAEIGAGYNYVWYDKYRCGECGAKLDHGHTNYAGITKLGLSIMYIF